MAWPFESIDYFDHGDITLSAPDGPWDAAVDTTAKLSLQHYTDMPGKVTPFTGSYSLRCEPLSATTGYLADESTSILATETGYFAFALYLPSNFRSPTNNRVEHIFRCLTGAAADAASMGLQMRTGDDKWRIFAKTTDGTADTTGNYLLDDDTWYWIEIEAEIQTGSNSTMTVYARKQGEASRTLAATASTAAAAAAVTETRIGVVEGGGNNTSGAFYMDHYHFNDPTGGATIGPPRVLFDEDISFAGPRQLFVGPGKVNNLTLVGGTGSDNELYLYDTDTAQVSDDKLVAVLKNTAALETVDVASTPIHVTRGAYAVLRENTGDTDVYNATVADGRGLANVSPRYFGSREMIRRLRGMR